MPSCFVRAHVHALPFNLSSAAAAIVSDARTDPLACRPAAMLSTVPVVSSLHCLLAHFAMAVNQSPPYQIEQPFLFFFPFF
jgi:hypothetical protein